ncbi:MAG: hypothetical protein U1F98_04400 [Verrucomicrobiota bacterium]
MRILLQQKQSGLYFKDINAWTRDPADAVDFLSSTSAMEFCRINKILDVQMVLKFEEQHCDIVMSMALDSAGRQRSQPAP